MFCREAVVLLDKICSDVAVKGVVVELKRNIDLTGFSKFRQSSVGQKDFVGAEYSNVPFQR